MGVDLRQGLSPADAQAVPTQADFPTSESDDTDTVRLRAAVLHRLSSVIKGHGQKKGFPESRDLVRLMVEHILDYDPSDAPPPP